MFICLLLTVGLHTTCMDGCWWHHAVSPLPCAQGCSAGPAQLQLWVVPLCCGLSHCAMQCPGSMWGPMGPQDQGGPVKANSVLQHIPEPHICGCKAACMGCVTWSLCLITIYFQAALLQLCSTAAICICGWQWWGKSHPLSSCPLIHPADECLPACLADSAGRAVAPCQGLLKSSHHIDWPCHHLRDVFL